MNRIRSFLALAALAIYVGCSSSSTSPPESDSVDNLAAVAQPEGDTSVPPELGGPGFTGEGWTTADPGPLGDPRAVKGGTMLSNIPAWPDNLRMYGIRSNTSFNYMVRDMCYMTLVGIDERTLEFVPGLASHWKISDDKMTFSFRINPKAHWSDGTPVTAQDVIATFRLLGDETLLAPMSKETVFDKFHEPVAKSKYIVQVESKELDWRNFISFAGNLLILPAHEIEPINGKEYLDEYNFKYTAVCGAYIVDEKDIRTDESITLTRRSDWWAADEPMYKGLFNIDKIRFVVIREARLAFDKACKGDLDYMPVNTAKWWVEDLEPLDAVKQGHLIRRKVFTKYPKGFSGQALNLRHPRLSDVRVRKALAHLFDRKTMLEKFAYNEYEPLKSYYPRGEGENLDNVLVDYDPHRAAELLADAGWSERGSDGILARDGKRFSITMTYSTPGLEKYYTVYQEACKQAGVDLKLELVDHQTRWNNLQDRKFEVASTAWGALLFPNPRTGWLSTLADKKGSNNFVGFQNAEADRLIEEYDKEFDLSKRTELLRQLDAVMFNEHSYVLGWVMPCERFIYWNKFGMPDTVLHKYQEWDDAFFTWWVDPEKERALKEARKTGSSLPIAPMIVRPWDSQEIASAN